ncbi:unnamed protein product [Tilletia laevis]|uniref:Enoyl reductase (ER) domain-containing protein n=2 Tax=Tilletia TaxID=13289 RepID=A0A177UU96_9BASI|nr:hypothetical protein CF336_g2331 [Tilletia laevis]KAE8263103.1 hypothetical protein A4X03_0g1929 [Tilletia caries]CAD6971849.1 unnamed protein product [Tilletia controversa]KAE8206697.1 hypothetical protein CF335_g1688 [Tilletia laevis]CAD6890671.1 unnamed protein product [Tilletia caries]
MASASIPSTMRAVRVKDGKGPSDALYLDDNYPVPKLETGSDTVLVRVEAFGLNRMDILQREGKYPLPPGAPEVLGVEFAGQVVAFEAGPNSSQHWKAGDEVFGLTLGGCYAEYVVAQARMTLPKPDHISHAEAASVPEAWFTAFQALRLLSDVQPGDDVLIHAGASGVGLAAIQLARDFGASKVYVTAGSATKLDFCKSVGANGGGINYKEGNWADELRKLTDGKGVDVIMDFLGASYFRANLDSLKLDGRMTMQGLMGGTQLTDKFDISAILGKRLTIRGSMLRSRSLEYQSNLVQAFLKEGVLDKCIHAEKSQHKLVIHKTYPWTEVKAAHDEMEANSNIGKLILTIE